MKKLKLFFFIACCFFLTVNGLCAKADLFSQNGGQNQFQTASINQSQIMTGPTTHFGGITIYGSDRPREYRPTAINNYNFNFNNFSNYYYFTNIDYYYNNYYRSTFDSDLYNCPWESSQSGYNDGYGYGYSASYILTYDESFYEDCFDNDYDHGGGNNGSNCRLVFCAAENIYKVGCAHNNYKIDCGNTTCSPKTCPTGYTGNITGKLVNGVCNYSDLSTCKPKQVVCTQESRCCPDGSTMPRNLQTCEWLPSQCSSHDDDCVCPVAAAPTCRSDEELVTENKTTTCSRSRTLQCPMPVCKPKRTTHNPYFECSYLCANGNIAFGACGIDSTSICRSSTTNISSVSNNNMIDIRNSSVNQNTVRVN